MLNIPDEVKALFKRDDIYKNFRVHFPNGETSDFDNSSVLTESVKFTESICSQQSFRFGLTEASEIQFTAVNIPNIRGVTIECAMDIDVTSLGMTWINANLSEGDHDFLDETCYLNVAGNGGFYRVPYGRFIVDTCPRNHESMWKREITAYTERVESDSLNPYITKLMNTYHFGKAQSSWSPMVMPLTLSLIANNSDCETILSEYGYEQITVPVAGATLISSFSFKDSAGETVSIQFKRYRRNYILGNLTSKNLLFTTDLNPTGNDNVKSKIVEVLTACGVDAAQSGYESMEAVADYCISEANIFSFEITVSFLETQGVGVGVSTNYSTRVIYPRFNDVWGDLRIDPYFTIKKSTDAEETPIYRVADWNDNKIKLWDLTDTANPFYDASFSINSTLNYYNGSFRQQVYAYTNAISLKDVVQGFLELNCKFESPARHGGFEISSLDNANPISVIPSEYSSLWYDETTVSPIGTVKIKFRDGEGDQETEITIGDGLSVYDMTNNAIFENMVITLTSAETADGKSSVDKVTEMLNTLFTPNIPDLSFIPIELEKKGLPYLEAGDAIEVETEDGQTVPSFILRQTISGIQYLSADVESANGEAMEIIES